MSGTLSLLTRNLKELRIHLCQKSPASEGVREFVQTMYVDLKKANPNFPILVREAEGVEAKMIARYAKGQEKAVSVAGMSRAQVGSVLEKLVKG